MVWLGVDLGNARVGLALSDPELTLAHPAGNVPVNGDSFFALDPVIGVIEDEGVDHVVVGLPLQMDGARGFMKAELAHNNPASTVYWHMDEEYMGQTQDFHQITLQPSTGRHTLTAVDSQGNTISTLFYVENK